EVTRASPQVCKVSLELEPARIDASAKKRELMHRHVVVTIDFAYYASLRLWTGVQPLRENVHSSVAHTVEATRGALGQSHNLWVDPSRHIDAVATRGKVGLVVQEDASTGLENAFRC